METPYILLNKEKLIENCKLFTKLFPKANIFYSVKANNDIEVLKIIYENGIKFDVASMNEIQILEKIGVKGKDIVFSAPTKIPSHIEYAYKYGIDRFAFDSERELIKLSKLAPGSKVYARLTVENAGSEWPLIRKFGIEIDQALDFLLHSYKLGLIPYGVTFHVGSQNLNVSSWNNALLKVNELFKRAEEFNLDLKMVDIGGGFPVQYIKDIPKLEDTAENINSTFKELFPSDTDFYIEPGRSLVGNTAVLVTTVVNRAKRVDGKNWLYIDVGAYNGLQETLEGFRYKIKTSKDNDTNKLIPYVICGPTCDSTDKFMEDTLLPSNLDVGDILFFSNAGAYTNSYEHYNGLNYPQVVIQ